MEKSDYMFVVEDNIPVPTRIVSGRGILQPVTKQLTTLLPGQSFFVPNNVLRGKNDRKRELNIQGYFRTAKRHFKIKGINTQFRLSRIYEPLIETNPYMNREIIGFRVWRVK